MNPIHTINLKVKSLRNESHNMHLNRDAVMQMMVLMTMMMTIKFIVKNGGDGEQLAWESNV